jgi:predicted O-methyltransferase YrrM
MMDPTTAFSIMNVILTGRHLVRDFKYRKFLYVDMARNEMAEEVADDPGCTHALWLDDDMDWKPDLLYRLLAHHLPVVGANYFRRMPPYDTVAGNWVDSSPKVLPLAYLPSGIEQVGCLGMGATLIRADVFRQMRQHYNDSLWFRSKQCGEDVWFCNRCREMNIPVYLDGSLVCSHQTTQVVTDEHWRAYHSKDPAQDPTRCDFSDLYAEAVMDAPDGGVLVEVGSYLGASAIAMCKHIKASGKHLRFVCVDHFRGSADEIHQNLAAHCGGSYRKLFEANLDKHGVQNMVEVIEGDSAGSADLFRDRTVDFVFIDAEHTTEAVKRDVNAWLPKVKPGGTLAGHDWNWATVRDGVRAVLGEDRTSGLKEYQPYSWLWRKPA